MLFDETVPRGRSRKLSVQWIGPYTITEIDKVNATLTSGRKSTKVHVKRLKLFYCIRWADVKNRVFALLQMTSELIVLVTCMMLRVPVRTADYEMKF